MKITTDQVERTGDILGIAVVQRLDRIIELLEDLNREADEVTSDDDA